MSFDLDAFEASLRAAGETGTPAAYCVALSGGLDSTVALHALVQCGQPGAVRAVHVDHGLHADSERWSRHCEDLCRSLDVPFEGSAVTIDRARGESLEAIARDARYRTLAATLGDGEILVTGHHADDQLETVLLQLMRGAGTAGLAAMPVLAEFPPGWLFRPLLAWTRAELRAWALASGLEWLEDPSNRDTGFDRNYLRQEVLPVLASRWPNAAKSATRSARLCAEATALTRELAAADLECMATPGGLLAAPLCDMPPERARNALRHWLATTVGRPPDSRRLESIIADVLPARPDSCPEVRWPQGAVRRYRGKLFALDAATLAALDVAPEPLDWSVREALELGEPFGSLRVVRADGPGLAPEWLESGELRVRWREGGESLRPFGQGFRRPLKKLLQEAGVPPWWRGRIPLIFAGDRLLAVGDLWVEDSVCRDDPESWSVEWLDRPDAIVVPPVIW